MKEAKNEFASIANQEKATLIRVTNEIKMGVHAEIQIARKSTELQGSMNPFLASNADQVILMVSGVLVKIKEQRNSKFQNASLPLLNFWFCN